MSEPTYTPERHLLGDQEDVFEALVALAEAFGQLPTPYITIHRGSLMPRVKLQLDSPSLFEVWRTALGIPSAAVELHTGNMPWLSAEGAFSGTALEITGHGIQTEAARAVAA